MIDAVTNADSLPVLERMLQFSGQRHKLIVNNIANLSTPGYRPVDVSVEAFREQLSEAVDRRRETSGNRGGPLPMADTRQVEVGRHGLDLRPEPLHDNILFHDGNDRDLERTMQDLVENFSMFRLAAQLMRNRLDLINTAIRERV